MTPTRRTMLLALAGAALLFFLFAINARAFDNAGAMQIAVQHYGQPCGGAVSYQWDHLGSDVNARATWTAYEGQGPEAYTECTITWSLDVQWDPAKFCTVTEHETGHLTGHVHEEDAIMAAYYTVPSPECMAAYPARIAWRPGRVAALDSNPRAAVRSAHRIHPKRRTHAHPDHRL